MLKARKEREAHGWSISRLAREAELHISTVSSIESGRLKPYRVQAEKLAHALGWQSDPADLFKEAE